jgi:hypothetical protein
MELDHKPWTTSGLGPLWSTTRRRNGSPTVAVRGEGGRGGRGGAGGALTGDGAVVKRPGDGGKAAAMKARSFSLE